MMIPVQSVPQESVKVVVQKQASFKGNDGSNKSCDFDESLKNYENEGKESSLGLSLKDEENSEPQFCKKDEKDLDEPSLKSDIILDIIPQNNLAVVIQNTLPQFDDFCFENNVDASEEKTLNNLFQKLEKNSDIDELVDEKIVPNDSDIQAKSLVKIAEKSEVVLPKNFEGNCQDLIENSVKVSDKISQNVVPNNKKMLQSLDREITPFKHFNFSQKPSMVEEIQSPMETMDASLLRQRVFKENVGIKTASSIKETNSLQEIMQQNVLEIEPKKLNAKTDFVDSLTLSSTKQADDVLQENPINVAQFSGTELHFNTRPTSVHVSDEAIHNYNDAANGMLANILQQTDEMRRQRRNSFNLKISLFNGESVHCRIRLTNNALQVQFDAMKDKLTQALTQRWSWLSTEASKRNLELKNPEFLSILKD